MKVILTALSDKKFAPSRRKLMDSVHKTNPEIETHDHDFAEIENSEFYKKNKEILRQKRGLGYWLWKPYIISQELNNMQEGDILIYSDAEIEVIDSLTPLVELAKEQPLILFGNAIETNNLWVKRDCFILMDCDTPEYWFSPHIDAAFLLVRKCQSSIDFVASWLEYSQNENILTDTPNICGEPNIDGFREHREDQSVLSLMSQKFKLDLYRMPSQFGNFYKAHKYRVLGELKCVAQSNQKPIEHYATIPYYNSPYGQLINHHRSIKKDQVKAQAPNVSTEETIVTKKNIFTRIINKIIK